MDDDVKNALGALAQRIERDRSGVREAMHRRVTVDVPQYFAEDPAVTSVGHDALEPLAAAIADVVRPDRVPQDLGSRIAEEAAIAVRSGTSWGVFEDCYRACMAGAWEWLMAEVSRLGLGRVTQLAVVGAFTRELFTWFGLVIQRARSEYSLEKAKVARSASRRRAELIRDLVAGRSVGERELGYPLDCWHRMLVVWKPGAAVDRQTVRGGVGAQAVMYAEAEDGSLWIVIGSTTPDLVVVDLVKSLRIDSDVRVAAGSAHFGVKGFVGTFHEAMSTYGLALRKLDGRPRQVTESREVVVEGLLSWDLAAATRVAVSELGPLAEDTARAERHRGTLAAYVDSACSSSTAAKVLGVSERTVRHRLAAIETALGTPISGRSVELGVALRILRAQSWRDARNDEGVLPVPQESD
ncbi:hypothetical protein nbrc107696_09820 [Gordonia spumicola]|uniref:PucR C-terminal helix-turn-helix domain-containing protein n=1 Tax=Gordonia spumicola TaxID=589161 RepID=A0A7I9V569_9ACTN|nr:helix-turn-helix domain-containing protein [Gordonia spumicola]GEE00536.1 hypothetical protein nbrc107696_09820 [Gordonia spumicola]